MTENPEDDGLVTKGAVQNAIARATQKSWPGKPSTISRLMKSIEVAIDKLPAVLPNSRQAREVKSREEIERAIKNLEHQFDEMKTQNHPWGSYSDLRLNINLLNCILNQPQQKKGYPGSTWDEEEIFGKVE